MRAGIGPRTTCACASRRPLDNITHSLAGVALADLLLRETATRGERRLFVGASLVAASAPDVDLVYTWITPPPIGFLLHHRGHTHTILGLFALGAILVMLARLLPVCRQLTAADRIRLWMLIAAGLGSHLLLDAFNSYGVHPFYPLDCNWYYGDAVFVFEPWLWVPLGVAVAWNRRSRAGGVSTLALVVALLSVVAVFGIVSPTMLVALLVAGLVCTVFAGRVSRRARVGMALGTCGLLLCGMFGLSRIARHEAEVALQPVLRGELVDVVLTPNPASPPCWAVIGIERDERAGEFVLWNGTLSIFRGWTAPTDCASHRLNPAESRLVGEGRLALRAEIRQPLQRLRELSLSDCRARAWLQFGRAPVLTEADISDLRFEQRLRANFSTMPLGFRNTAGGCPFWLPGWAMPRADLLTP